LDVLWPVLEAYPPEQRDRLTFYRPEDSIPAIWLHPGEPVFDQLRASTCERFRLDALRGAVFVDPAAHRPYLFHLATVSVLRKGDPDMPALAGDELLENRLIALRQEEGGAVEQCPVERLLLLRGSRGVPLSAITLVANAKKSCEEGQVYATDSFAQSLADEKRNAVVSTLPERESFVRRGFDYQDAELAAMRAKRTEKARAGDPRAKAELTQIKERQRNLAIQMDSILSAMRREPELIVPGEVRLLAHALVVPSSDPDDRRRYDEEVEALAVKMAWAFEEGLGARVKDVSTPGLALSTGLTAHPGFDLLSRRDHQEELAIEVKGRAGGGEVEITENEWAKACNLRERYWLYVVYDCASPSPRLLRVQDPFGKLLASNRTGVLIAERSILAAAEK